MSRPPVRQTGVIAAAIAAFVAAPPAAAQFAPIYPGPLVPDLAAPHSLRWEPVDVTSTGIAVANVTTSRFDEDIGFTVGSRAFRWDTTGAPPQQLTTFGAGDDAFSFASVSAVNEHGVAVGQAERTDPTGVSTDRIPVVWGAGGGDPMELATRSATPQVMIEWMPVDINSAGAIVGSAAEPSQLPGGRARTAVMWDSPETVARELAYPATDSNVESLAMEIADSGIVVGIVRKRTEAGANLGSRPVRWDASGVPAELAPLGASVPSQNNVRVLAANGHGAIVGKSAEYDEDGELLRVFVPVRWPAGTTDPEVLGDLPFKPFGHADSSAYDINDAGTAVGLAFKFNGPDGPSSGTRPVLWEAGSTMPVELDTLVNDPIVDRSGVALSINNRGQTVGEVHPWGGVERAMLWTEDRVAVDLNSLIDPASGWVLNRAEFISDAGWILGTGTFDIDGEGGAEPRTRLFMLRAPPPSFPGDYNADGKVEQGDLDLVLLHWGRDMIVPPDGWIRNLPVGHVNQAELDAVLLNWGKTQAAVDGVGAVPEPASVVLLIALLLPCIVCNTLLVAPLRSRPQILGEAGLTTCSRLERVQRVAPSLQRPA